MGRIIPNFHAPVGRLSATGCEVRRPLFIARHVSAALFRLLARLPLPLLQALGAMAGWLTLWLDGTYRRRLHANLAQAGLSGQVSAEAAAAEAGKGALELPWLWLRPSSDLAARTTARNWELVEAAQAAGRGIIFLTPHLGCFEATARYYAQRPAPGHPDGAPITVLYREPRQAWLRELVEAGRARGSLQVARADLGGVRRLARALRAGEAVGLLPDQVPSAGEGVWAPFFGKPAFTMTLPARLQAMSGATILLAHGERLPGGRGWVVHLHPFDAPLHGDTTVQATQINAALEAVIRRCPHQYAWGYNRYKTPRAQRAGDPEPPPAPTGNLTGANPTAVASVTTAPDVEPARGHYLTRLGLLLLRLLAGAQLVTLRALGARFGLLLYVLAAERRRVATTNIRLCFPEMHARARGKLVRAHFRAFGQSFIDRSLLWHAPASRLRALIRIEAQPYLDAALASGRPVIVLAPHFVGLDAGWLGLTRERPMLSMYANQKNPVFNAAMRAGRLRFRGAQLLSRQQGIRSALRGLKEGLPFYYLPDMDFGPRDAIFVPFFGVPAATVAAIARIASLANALVVPCVTRLVTDGYVVRFYPAWDDYPGDDIAAATRRMNAFIEDRVRELPAQYLWVHKRFKTRPAGTPGVY